MADDKKTKEEKPEKKHAKGEGPPPAAKPEGEKKAKKGGKREKAPATIQAAQGKAHAKGDHPPRLADFASIVRGEEFDRAAHFVEPRTDARAKTVRERVFARGGYDLP